MVVTDEWWYPNTNWDDDSNLYPIKQSSHQLHIHTTGSYVTSTIWRIDENLYKGYTNIEIYPTKSNITEF